MNNEIWLDDCLEKMRNITEETVSEAALKLYKASQNKNVKIMFLITFKKREYLDQFVTIPPEIKIIEAPSLIINNILNHFSQKSLV